LFKNAPAKTIMGLKRGPAKFDATVTEGETAEMKCPS
jgi:hypothetical protein